MQWGDLAGTLARLGAPSIGRMLAGPAGEAIGEVVGKTVSAALGIEATPEAVAQAAVNSSQELRVVLDATEHDAAVQASLAAIETAAIDATLKMATNDREEGWFAYAWRPGTMYLLGFFWTWVIVLQPVLTGFGFFVPLYDDVYSTLTALTTAYLVLYMGGHTVKATIGTKH